VRHWARKLDVSVVWLAIRPMRQKWASCSTNGHLHFSVPDHGRLWKALMRSHLGHGEPAAERLERHAAGQSAGQASR
jgi:hypothetical protein